MTTALATPELRTIRVYGTLARLIGCRTLRATVSSVPEAMRFLIANFPQVEGHLKERFFKVKIASWALTESDLNAPIGLTEEVHIIPAICGAGGNGPVVGILAGAALIGAGLLLPFGGSVLVPLGAGLLLNGIAALLSPTPTVPDKENDPARSYNFSGIQQTSTEGVPVPLVYGDIVTGSVVLSVNVGEDEEELEPDFDAGGGDPNVPDPEEVADLNTIFNDMDALYPGICWGLEVRDYIRYRPDCECDENNPNCGLSSWGTYSETRLFSRMGQGNYFQSLSNFYVAFYRGDQCYRNEIGSQITYTWLKNCDGVVVNQQKGWGAFADYFPPYGYINNKWACVGIRAWIVPSPNSLALYPDAPTILIYKDVNPVFESLGIGLP